MNDQMTETQRQALISAIRMLPDQLEALVRDLSSEQLTTAYIPGEWTVAQNVHHLADSHMNAYIRTKLILSEEHPTLKPYDQDRWAEYPDASVADLATSLGILRGLHQRWTQLFAQLTAADWQRTGLHPEIGAVSVADILQSYANHGQAHLDQITKTLSVQ